jgi:hypothetical protein
VRGIFTIITEAGEETCDLHLHQLFTPTTNSSEGTDGGETPRVGAVGGVGRSEEKRPPSALTSIIRVEKPRRRSGGEVLKAWVKHDPDAIRLATKSSKETFSTNKVRIEEQTISTPTFFF